MNLKEIDMIVYRVERGEMSLTENHILVKAMQHYLNVLYGEWHSLEDVKNAVIWNCEQFSINYSIDLLNALESYKEVQSVK